MYEKHHEMWEREVEKAADKLEEQMADQEDDQEDGEEEVEEASDGSALNVNKSFLAPQAHLHHP